MSVSQVRSGAGKVGDGLPSHEFPRIEVAATELRIRPADRRFRPLQVRQIGDLAGQPFLRWTGGKQWLARAIPLLAPPRFERYFECFLGGGSTFFALAPERSHLSDANAELIEAFVAVRREPERVIENLRRWKYDRNVFNRVRAQRPRSPAAAAARFIYLNRTAFNGIYRVNREGMFNVPFGAFSNPQVCNRERIRECSRVLGSVNTIRALDFEEAARRSRRGDFVYFDPPYITGHMNNGFVKWNARLFSWRDQERLARLADELSGRGVHVLVSNADHPEVSKLYTGFHRYRLERASQIAGPTRARRRVTEMLAASYPLQGVPARS